nr:hypothetical protein [Tanacetum cinerariifolium]
TCVDQIIRRCVAGQEAIDILNACHSGPLEAIMVPATQQKKSLIQVSTGLPFIKMLLSS